ncbi:hypothetical protein FACS18949_07420 [Clostridia bacterium]|nr:hypothetical protein FACS18949_07420 [Clostridia bacterium]
MKKYVVNLALLVTGGGGYGALEILWRGYTHYSMVIAGALCLPLLVLLSRTHLNFALLCVTGGALVTALEFTIGCVVNLWWGLGVWDYSGERFNVLGQICPRFFLIWCGLCAVVFGICRVVKRGYQSSATSGTNR